MAVVEWRVSLGADCPAFEMLLMSWDTGSGGRHSEHTASTVRGIFGVVGLPGGVGGSVDRLGALG